MCGTKPDGIILFPVLLEIALYFRVVTCTCKILYVLYFPYPKKMFGFWHDRSSNAEKKISLFKS